MGILGKLGRGALGLEKGSFAAAPWSTAAIAGSAAVPLAQAGGEFIDQLDLFGAHSAEPDRQRRGLEDFNHMVRERDRRMRKLRAANLEAVSRHYPDVYNSVAAGRDLPEGAIVIGGSPRVDLLTELADGMAAGQIGA